MATRAYPATQKLSDGWEKAIDGAAKRKDAATPAGIVGDLRHRRTGGYHISREDILRFIGGDYSTLQFNEDKSGPPDGASAVDMTMRPEQMIAISKRLARCVRAKDPRTKFMRAFNGTVDGKKAIRVEVKSGQVYSATEDHLWHIHLEVYRKFLNDPKMTDAILSMIVGEALDTWRKRNGFVAAITKVAKKIVGKPTQEVSMPKIRRVRNDTGSSNTRGVLNVYSYVHTTTTESLICQIASFYPKAHEIYVTSGSDGDHGPRPYGSHHYGKLRYGGSLTGAVDFGANDRCSDGARRMRDFAKWCEDVVGVGNIVELIHTTPFNDNGYYVRHGGRLGGYGFGPGTNAGHRDHVHLAMSEVAARRVLAKLKAKYRAVSTPTPKAPVTGATDGGPVGEFPITSTHVFGATDIPMLRRSWHDGYFAADQPHVRAIQREVGIPATGRYFTSTAIAVKTWQRAVGLKATGAVDKKTWDTMRRR